MNTLSIVVPAFNESAHLGECLDALLEQQEHIHEIIVVDNNSTDDTAAIVLDRRRRFPMVTLVAEFERGVVHARNAGFDHASGSIIGRIDADTHVGAGWAKSVLDFFDRRLDYAAVTGPIYLYDSPWAAPYRAFVKYTTKRKTDELRVSAASGNNFAIRRSAWEAARDRVSVRTDLHEDIDLSLCLYRVGLRIAQIKSMCVEVSGRRLLTPPLEYRHYVLSSYRTWAFHNLAGKSLRRLLVADMVLHTVHWPLTRMLSTCDSRILPVSHSDTSVTPDRHLSAIREDRFAAASGK
ncbi:glycosyltransferase family A protein [Rhodococcus sp. IEGM 1381]|uniref:glycosyltransferase family 2 protein n=1 Tax=Rhodococcus sp. IEGM 1381 TaxID=3047085 RepID=UPI0024B7FAFC|nr:glycosyltransferase family A protein [Rhodococcus sp. IEGM 1381]MDI9894981.1 glycosyltransferase family A protein [Rhodococcus sp. IEGM 1381]